MHVKEFQIDLYQSIQEEWLKKLPQFAMDIEKKISAGELHRKHLDKIVSKEISSQSSLITKTASADKNVKSEIGIINISGPMLYSEEWWHEYFGVTSHGAVGRALDELLSDSSVKTIILRVQSPGGTSFGCEELSQKIFDARSKKRVIAFADPYAFSAAYWVGSAASEFYCMPSGMVGSIGSYSMHVDLSEYYSKQGVKITHIKAGEKKIDANEYEPLSARAKKDIQIVVDRFYDSFVSDVAKNRSVSIEQVKENFGQGGVVLAEDALNKGMIDGIKTFEDFVSVEIQSLGQLSFVENKDLQARQNFVKYNKQILDLEED